MILFLTCPFNEFQSKKSNGITGRNAVSEKPDSEE